MSGLVEMSELRDELEWLQNELPDTITFVYLDEYTPDGKRFLAKHPSGFAPLTNDRIVVCVERIEDTMLSLAADEASEYSHAVVDWLACSCCMARALGGSDDALILKFKTQMPDAWAAFYSHPMVADKYPVHHWMFGVPGA